MKNRSLTSNFKPRTSNRLIWTEEIFLKRHAANIRRPGKKENNSVLFFSGLAPYAGSWTINEVAHLLKRTMFGATKADIDYFLTLSPDAAIDELLNNITTPSPPVRDYGLLHEEDGIYDDLGVAQGQTWVNDPNMASNPEVRGQI
ncbi:MAG: hypothetical protein ACXWV8_13425, partial [Chitinophagaceae bacterium]